MIYGCSQPRKFGSLHVMHIHNVLYIYLSFVLFQEAIGAVITGAPRADVVISSTYVAHLMTLCVGGGEGRE